MGIALKDAKDPKTGEITTTWEVRASNPTEVTHDVWRTPCTPAGASAAPCAISRSTRSRARPSQHLPLPHVPEGVRLVLRALDRGSAGRLRADARRTVDLPQLRPRRARVLHDLRHAADVPLRRTRRGSPSRSGRSTIPSACRRACSTASRRACPGSLRSTCRAPRRKPTWRVSRYAAIRNSSRQHPDHDTAVWPLQEATAMKDWRSDMPFPRHWLFYTLVKIGIVLFAIWVAARSLGYV